MSEYLDGACTLDYLARVVEAWRRINTSESRRAKSPSRPDRLSTYEDRRALAISLLAFYDASEDDDVVTLRKELLRDELIQADQVDDWMQRAGGQKTSRLFHRAQRLTTRYPWTTDEAMHFLLTDEAPVIEPVRVQRRETWSARPYARVVLTVDPEVAPSEVARIYSAERRRILGNRVRPLAPSSLELAIFVAARPGWSWRELHNAWCREHREHATRDHRSFSRAARSVLKRLRRPTAQRPTAPSSRNARDAVHDLDSPMP